jgi:tripartite ATP-independent transporter DctM subunit
MIGMFLVLAVFGTQIAIALGLAVMVTVVFASNFQLVTVMQRMVSGVDSYTLLAIPLFMLTGRLMNDGGITQRIFDFCKSCVGHIRGGLGHVNVLASMIFAGMSGSAVADAGGLGQVEIEAMNEQGYPPAFSAAVTAVSSAIGPIIPPSIPFVMYAAIAEVSPGDLFLAGMIPGILMGLAMMITIYILSFIWDFPKSEKKASLSRRVTTLKKAILSLMTPIIIMGGIMTGIFTPTEASAVAAVYAFVLSFFVYKSITIRDIPVIIVDTVITTSLVVFIMSTSSAFSWILIMEKVAASLSAFATAFSSNKIIILLILNMVMLFLGCFMEAGMLITLLTPLFVPIANALGVDLVQFGVIMVLNLMIGVVTPPVGMSLYVVSKLSGLSIEEMTKPVLILLIPLIVVLLGVTFIPDVSLFLVRILK